MAASNPLSQTTVQIVAISMSKGCLVFQFKGTTGQLLCRTLYSGYKFFIELALPLPLKMLPNPENFKKNVQMGKVQ